ncbi:MAG: type II toxin-antitoxin system VapC family toxin, partial [Planctomycetes bacterium]|nr:type II toxin-antitoxin system VapC family toxin [Planctomycetota bacterium]
RASRSRTSRSTKSSMANEIFVDTSGFFALLVSDDDRHQSAQAIMRAAQRRKRGFMTTDYVLDETATLLKARGYRHLLADFFAKLDGSHACRTEWTDAERFGAAKVFFLKHADQAWSFTDCLSFVVMKSLRLRDAFTKDGHFQEAGFVALLK